MRNFTFRKSGFFRPFFLIVFLLLTAHNVSAQFYTKHYIAPAPWQYFSKANEIVISTNSLTNIDITVAKSDGTTVTTLKAKKGTPAVYRFSLLARDLPMNALNTVLNGAGLIVTSTGPTAVNLRNIASDDYKDDENRDANIKGNAALTSFGDAGLGIRFRVGYYRDGSLGSFSSFGEQRPIYSIMATIKNTTIKINNVIIATLNQGQSYLFKAPIGTLVESSNPIVMNTSAAIDMPGGCGDGAFNQIPPESVLGTEYFLERGTGNNIAEQTTVVATKDDTNITVESYSATGVLVKSTTKKLDAGSFYTFVNGVEDTNFTASRVVADKRVAVYSGTAQTCEVDISTIAPVSECGGSEFIETSKFKNYKFENLDYFGYILLRSSTEDVTINGVKTTSIAGVKARYQIGSTGWYIINFNSEQIGRPEVLSIESKAKLTVSIVQQSGGFSMAGFFSTFAALPDDPTLTYIEGGGCTNNTAKLTTQSGYDPYQWYYNGTAISGANSSTYIATKTGNYSVSYTLACGAQTPSKTASVTLCTDLGITKTVDNATPCIGSNVEFTVKVSNLGGNNVSGISVTDLLPSGYTYASSIPSVGVYDSATGVWTIGDVAAQTSMTLKIVATVNASGNYTNTASLPNGIDTNTANNSASAAVNPKSANLVIANPASVCAPSTVNLTASAVTAGSSSNLTLSYWTNSGATAALSSPSAVTASGTYYIKAVSADGCTFVKPVVVTVNPQPATPTITRTNGASIANGSISCFGATSITLRATSSTGYLWSTGEITQDIVVTADGTYSVKVLNSSNCMSESSSPVSVTLTPAAPTAAANQSFCASENKKVGDLVATGSNLKWYSAPTNGTQYAENTTLTAGNYYVSQTSANGCESSRTQVKVTISASSAPVASAQTFCFAENKKISDLNLVVSGDNLKWYNQSSGGTQYTGTETLVTRNYYVSQTAGTCSESARTLVAVTINNVPSEPTASSQIFCITDSKTINDLKVISGSNLKWYNQLTGGTLYNGTETLSSGNYYVSQTNNCGESTRTAVSVTVNNTAAPTASSQTFCSGELKKVSNLSPSGAAYKWYSANTGGTLYTGTETLVTGTYYVSQTTNGCESLRTSVNVTVNQTPAAPSASAQTFCSSENKIVKDLVATGSNLKWYDSSTGGTQYSGNEALTSGNYYVSQTINSCESTRLLVSVTVNPTPAAPSISADEATTFCQGGSVTLTSTGGSSYLWSTGATTQSITVSASGNYSVKVSNASGCYSAFSTATTVTVNALPSAPTASAQTFCSSDNKKVGDLSPSGGSYKWYSASTGGTLYAGTETLATGTYYVSQTTNGCESSRTSASVTVNTTPSAPTASAQTFCSSDNKKVGDLSPSGASYKWYSASTGGTLYKGTETLATGTYYVSQTTNGCESSRTSVSVTVNTTPTAPTASAQTFCSSDNKKVGDLSPSGASYKWYSASTGGTLYTGTETLATGTYYVSQTSNGCESSRTSVSVTVNTTPSAPTASAQTFCSSDNKKVGDLSPSGASYKWYSANTGETLYTGTEALATGTYYVSQTTNGCESSRTSVSVTVNTTPSAPTASSQTFCSSDNKKVGDLSPSGASYKWYSASTGGTLYTGTETLATGTYYVSQTSNGCESSRTSVSVTVNSTPSAAVLSAITQPTCLDAKGNFTINNYNSAYNYTITPSTGVTNNAGTITAPAGSYIISVSSNGCFSSDVSFVIKSILCANEDDFGTKSSGSTTATIGNVKTNDTLNGVPVTSSNTVVTADSSGPLSVDANGDVTLAANTASGTYSITYEICEKGANPVNCKTATAEVKVVNDLIAVKDDFGTKSSGSASATIGNVKTNDTLDGAFVTSGNTVVTADSSGPLSVDANGDVTLAANTPSGTYSITYEICEKNANPSNCKTAVAEVKVANTIDAVIDTITPINGNIGGTTVSLIENDTLNGDKVVIGSNSGEVTLNIVGTLPSGLTLNANGTITVAPNTPKGNYNVEYIICEVGAVPANCDSVTITVPVTAGNLVANEDVIPSVLGSNAPQTLGKNVFDNDTKNTQPLNPSDVTLKTTAADPKGYLTVDTDGNIVLGANPPAGDYELTYEICEKLNPDNCSSNTVKVTVGTPVIDAVEDLIASINGNIGVTTIALTANDKLNGSPIVVGTAAGEVKFEIVGTLPAGLTLNSDYTITVAPNTPKGNYNVEYKICENTNPTNCDSVTITVPVTAGNLVANEDLIPSVLGSNVPQTLGKKVFDNDTKNTQPLNPSDVTLKTTAADPKGYLTVDADGNIVLGANPPAGDYELTYEICEKLNPDNCSSNTVKVTVGTPVIDAVEDTVASINGNMGGKTVSLTANDKLNGSPIVVGTAAGEVKFEIIGTLPAGLTLNSDYTITVAPNTPKGNYKVEYKICENTNPTNCDSVTITVPVTAGNLVANEDVIPSVLGSNAPQTLGKNVFENDTKNSQPLNPSDVTLKTTAADPKGYLTVNTDGNIVLGANPPAGDYELTYEICEKLNPDNCSSNTVKVTVGTPIIDAVEDVIASINGNIGGTTIALTANDKLKGSPIVVGTGAGEVKFEIVGTLPAGLTLNSDYTITVAPNTPAADYNVEYKICENTNPTNCDSVITVVKVTGGNLVANEDLVPSAVGVNIPQTVINVFENDTKDGNKLVPSDVDLKVTQADPKGYLTVDTDGNVVLAPNAPAGEYELTYTICEKLNPNNCDSNVVKVSVTEPKMNVTANSYCSNNVPYVNYVVAPENFTAHNLLTVRWIDSNNNVVATQTNLPLSGNILWPGAEIDSNKNGTDWPGWILNNGIWAEGADGFEATRNGVKIEFSLNPTVTVSVAYPPATPDCNARPTFSIKANNDEAGPVNVKKGANANINIFENDLLNGAKLKASDVILSVPVVHPNITLNADGSVNIATNTPDGVYELTYQICEAANASNCSQAVIKITVDNVVDPAPPTENKITLNNDNDVSADGINGSLEVVNVLDNDLINGQPINPTDVIIKPVTDSPYFEWNADGTVSVKPNTPGGNYPLTYQVCEKANDTNCSTAVLNVFVEVPAISVIKTAVFNDENKSGFANAGETITYKFTVTNTGNVPLVGITINDPLPGVVVSGQAINLGVNESNETNFTAVYKITQEDINRGSVSNQATVKGSSARGVVVEDQSDDSSNSGDSPTVLDLNGCSIKVMNAFSPNGDSKNARFYIRGIECYPDNTVEIYNRWGVLVFSIDQYNNNDRVFEGYSNGRSTIKQTDGLPVGTYFYVLKYKDSAQKSHQESGYLYLNK